MNKILIFSIMYVIVGYYANINAHKLKYYGFFRIYYIFCFNK